jgi:hypothetical protein
MSAPIARHFPEMSEMSSNHRFVRWATDQNRGCRDVERKGAVWARGQGSFGIVDRIGLKKVNLFWGSILGPNYTFVHHLIHLCDVYLAPGPLPHTNGWAVGGDDRQPNYLAFSFDVLYVLVTQRAPATKFVVTVTPPRDVTIDETEPDFDLPPVFEF